MQLVSNKQYNADLLENERGVKNINKLVSVIITNYNYEQYLSEAIESVLHQTYQHFELIIVDDGSKDNSAEIINKYVLLHPEKIKVVVKENGGQGSAFNAGYRIAIGEVIAFLDADDYWYENKLETIMKYHQKYDGIQHNLMINNQFKYTFLENESTKMQLGLNEFGFMGTIPTTGLSFSRKVLEDIMPVPEQDYRICADLYIRAVFLLYNDILSIENPLGFYRVHDSNHWYNNKSVSEDYITNTTKKLNDLKFEKGETLLPLIKPNHSLSAYMYACTEIEPNLTYVIYGTGFAGRYFYEQMKTIYPIHCFASTYIKESDFCDLVVVDIAYLKKNRDVYDKIIIASQQMTEIVDYLINNGIEASRIVHPRL